MRLEEMIFDTHTFKCREFSGREAEEILGC